MRNWPEPSVVTDRTFSISAGLDGLDGDAGQHGAGGVADRPGDRGERLGEADGSERARTTRHQSQQTERLWSCSQLLQRDRTLVAIDSPALAPQQGRRHPFLGVGLWRTSREAAIPGIRYLHQDQLFACFPAAVAYGPAAAHTPSYPRHNGRASASITRCGAFHMTNLVRSAATMVIAAAAGAALATLAMPVAGQAPPNRAPRTASGKPDLNGIWQALNEANYDIQVHMARPAMALRAGPVRSGARRRQCWRWARSVPCRRVLAWSRARSPYRPEALARKKENQENWLTARPGDQVLSARRAARHLHAVSVSDPPERQRDLDRLRVCGRGARHLSQGSGTGAGRFVDGPVGRAMGRRHAGRRGDRLQRPDLVRPRRQLPQRGVARRRALHPHRARTSCPTRRRSRIRRCSRGRGR